MPAGGEPIEWLFRPGASRGARSQRGGGRPIGTSSRTPGRIAAVLARRPAEAQTPRPFETLGEGQLSVTACDPDDPRLDEVVSGPRRVPEAFHPQINRFSVWGLGAHADQPLLQTLCGVISELGGHRRRLAMPWGAATRVQVFAVGPLAQRFSRT